MIYTFLVLIFGIYIGQEYPQIPSIKSTCKVIIENLNKVTEDNGRFDIYNNNDNDNDNENENKREYENEKYDEDKIEMKIVPIKRNYYSLPLWISDWWSSYKLDTTEIEHEKLE